MNQFENASQQYLLVYHANQLGRITVLCHFPKNDLMPVIMCKSDKHLVTLYNLLFSNITGILSHLSYIFY